MSDPTIPGFTMRERIGKGGMSSVYLALDEMGRQVAIKVIDGSLPHAAVLFEQFTQEAAIIGRLRHPSIIKIYRADQHQHWYFLVSEYLPGADLKTKIRAGITVDDALEITRKLTSALDVAHEAGLIHRDVKPENVLFRTNATPVLMDFGTAAASGHLRGTMTGTPLYMSPEQVNAREIDRRTDIYSLGAVLFEMLTGAPPYPLDSMEAILYAQVHRPVPTLPRELRELQGLIEGMMCKNVVDRIGSGKELLYILDDYWLLAPRPNGRKDIAATTARRVWRDASSGRLVEARQLPDDVAPADRSADQDAAGRRGVRSRTRAIKPALSPAQEVVDPADAVSAESAAQDQAAFHMLEQAHRDAHARQLIDQAQKLEDGARAAMEAVQAQASADPWQESYALARDYLNHGDVTNGTALLAMIASAAPGELAVLAKEMLYQLSR